jgi:HAD superfamily hydrolase (TIGR01509 family)
MQPEAVILDLDNTLFDRDAIMRALAQRWGVDSLSGSVRELHDRLVELLGDRAPTAPALRNELLERIIPNQARNERLWALADRLPVAIATNGGTIQRQKLARLGLTDIVRTVFVSGEIGSRKPSQSFFAHVLRWTTVPAPACLFVGDDLECDIAGAQRAGMKAAWISHGHPVPPDFRPDLTAPSIDDLLPMITPC